MIDGTFDTRNFRLLSEFPMSQTDNTKKVTVAGQIPDTSGIARLSKNRLALLALKHSNFTWVGLSTYE